MTHSYSDDSLEQPSPLKAVESFTASETSALRDILYKQLGQGGLMPGSRETGVTNRAMTQNQIDAKRIAELEIKVVDLEAENAMLKQEFKDRIDGLEAINSQLQMDLYNLRKAGLAT